jgi:predicted metal-dependent hydrolase
MDHMLVMDHSREFWDIVERIMPDYEKRHEWLKNLHFESDQ